MNSEEWDPSVPLKILQRMPKLEKLSLHYWRKWCDKKRAEDWHKKHHVEVSAILEKL